MRKLHFKAALRALFSGPEPKPERMPEDWEMVRSPLHPEPDHLALIATAPTDRVRRGSTDPILERVPLLSLGPCDKGKAIDDAVKALREMKASGQ